MTPSSRSASSREVVGDLLQPLLEVARRKPFGQRARLAADRPRIPEPDAGFGRELLHVGAAVGDEQERHAELRRGRCGHGPSERRLVRRELDVARVALGLAEAARHVLDARAWPRSRRRSVRR